MSTERDPTFDLEEAVRAAPPDGIVHLPAGIHRIGATLRIERSLTLAGDGAEQTILAGAIAGALVEVDDGRLTLCDLALRQESPTESDVVAASSGFVELLRCRLEGGTETDGKGGVALRLGGSAVGVMQDCTSVGQSHAACSVTHVARCTIEWCTLRAGWAGVVVWGHARACVRRTLSTGHRGHGIFVAGEARVVLEGNRCDANGTSGIWLGGSSGGVVRGNACLDNGEHGIVVTEAADPAVEGNLCPGDAARTGPAASEDLGLLLEALAAPPEDSQGPHPPDAAPWDPTALATGSSTVAASVAGARARAWTEWQPGQILQGDYAVERKLGQGGMGVVYAVRSSTGQRFAVKRASVWQGPARTRFLRELQTWIGLPEHPHVVTCRFVRSVGDEIAIFADYIEGGSLGAAVVAGRVGQLDAALDVAIQLAWGLDALHEQGLVHQDVKPDNVLLTSAGIAKVGDFGLARARAMAGAWLAPPPGASPAVSFAGLTRAYASPEQARGEPLGPATDIWSFGVTVLEVLLGGMRWSDGLETPDVLDAAIEEWLVPEDVGEVLQRCLAPRPADRWPRMEHAARELVAIHERRFGPFARERPSPMSRRAGARPPMRSTAHGGVWASPEGWLERAHEIAGSDRGGGGARPTLAASPEGYLASELATLDEAMQVLESAQREERDGAAVALVDVARDKALVHEQLGDRAGAAAMRARARAICEDLIARGGGAFPVAALAQLETNGGVALGAAGRHLEALELHERAIARCEELLTRGSELTEAGDVEGLLATARANRASQLLALGRPRDAIEPLELTLDALAADPESGEPAAFALHSCDLAGAWLALGDHGAALATCERALAVSGGEVDGRPDVANAVAALHHTKALVLQKRGELAAAMEHYGVAEAIRERLSRSGWPEADMLLAKTVAQKGNVALAAGDAPGAIAHYDRAIALVEPLVLLEGRGNLQGQLALAWMNRANALYAAGDPDAAGRSYDGALAIYERLVADGVESARRGLVLTRYNKAVLVLDDRPGDAVPLLDLVTAEWRRMLEGGGGVDVAVELAKSLVAMAVAYDSLDDPGARSAAYASAVRIYEDLVERAGQTHLEPQLEAARRGRDLAGSGG